MTLDPRLGVELDTLVALEEQIRPMGMAIQYKPEGVMSGRHRSRLRGNGLDFEELRPYQQGDSIRQMDWKSTLRTGKPYVRVYSEETDRPVILAVDMRPSMFFGSETFTKSMVAAHIAACLAWMCRLQDDRVGLSLASDTLIQIKPSRGPSRMVDVLQCIAHASKQLVDKKVHGSVSDDAWVDSLMFHQPPQSSLYLITDGSGLTDSVLEKLGAFSQRTNLSVMLVLDRFDKSLELAKGLVISDGVSQLHLDRELVNLPAYQKAYTRLNLALKELCLMNRLPFGEFNTGQDPVDQLFRLYLESP